MNNTVALYGKKIFSLALIFNSLMSIVCVIELLSGFYRASPYWQPFSPYLANGNLFWIAIIAAIVNIYPTASIGRSLKTGRFLFHHYVYGFFVLILAIFFVAVFTSASLVSLFTINTADTAVNAGRFFTLGGLALLIDDLPDVSQKISAALNWIKTKTYPKRKAIHLFQLLTGLATFYLSFAACWWLAQNPQAINIGNTILVSTLLITSLTSLACVKSKKWLNIKPVN